MKNRVGVLVLAMFLGCSGLVWADGEVFPVNFAATYADQDNTMVKVEGSELRLSIESLNGQSTQDYLVNVEQGTIAKTPGEMTKKGSEAFQSFYNSVLASLGSLRSGLAASGDTVNSEALGSTISYLQSWAV